MRKNDLKAEAGPVSEPGPAAPAREFLSIKEALAAYGFSRSFLYELMGRGLVRSAKVGRRRLVHAPTLRAFVRSRMDGADGHGGAARRARIEEVVRPGGGPGHCGEKVARHRAASGGPQGSDRPGRGGGPVGGADTARNPPTARPSGRRRP